ncbi:hypothetical protein KAH81_04680 [bacterium]|nr:hypothetical protein [bacterium]
MKFLEIMMLISLAGFAAWVEVSADSAHTLIAPDSTGISVVDSTVVIEEDTSANGLIRSAGIIYLAESDTILLQEIGYCVPPDSTRRFFAFCSELERWFKWVK